MIYKLTQEHFEIFKAECQKIIDLAGTDFFIWWQFKKQKDAAFVESNTAKRVAWISLSTEWLNEPTEENLIRVARHEAIHLITHSLVGIIKARYVTIDEVNEAIEGTTNILAGMVTKLLDKQKPICYDGGVEVITD